MERFRNILVIVDDPVLRSAALLRATEIAHRTGAGLTFVHAMLPIAWQTCLAVRSGGGNSMKKLEDDERQHRMKELRDMATGATKDGIPFSVKVLVGPPFREILREVIEGRYDLVLKDAPQRGAVRNSLYSSLDLHLMRKCPVPLWMVRSKHRLGYRRVVAAIHPEAVDPEHGSLNYAVLDLSAAVARVDGAELHVVHAWQVYGEAVLRHARSRMNPEQIDEILEFNRTRSAAMLERAVVDHPLEIVRNAQRHLINGSAAEALLQFTRRIRADLIVMGTVARTGVSGLIIGNTAETVLNQVACSVLAIKPPGFISHARTGEQALPEQQSYLAAMP